jgi:hypothetical protein
MKEKIFYKIDQVFLFILNFIHNNDILDTLLMYADKHVKLILITIGAVLYIATVNQLKKFAPNSDEKPLPFAIRSLLNITYYSKFLILSFFVYWLILNAMIIYIIAYKENFNLNINYLISITLIFIETLIILMFSLSRIRLVIWKTLVDKKIINPLDQIANKYHDKNSGKKIYKPEGIDRKTKDYLPKKYMKKKLMFHGLNASNKPVYTDFWKSLDGHYTIIGGTGYGKGILTRMYLYQTIKQAVTNIIIDPKPDNFMFDACCTFANEHNKNIYVIDLDNKKPQVSLFKDLDSESFAKIILSSLEFQVQKQSNAKIHAVRGEGHIYDIADKIYKENITPNELMATLQEYPELLKDDTLKEFFRHLDRVNIFNTKKGLSFKKLIESKDIIYIRCKNAKELDVARDIAQITIMTLFEHINQRDSYHATQCVMVIDEFKFIMNTVIMNNLATIRDNKCTLVFNFQDISNFMTSPNHGLHNADYATELLSNSHFIAVHNVSDTNLVKMIQERCGEAQYDKAFEHAKSNAGGGSETSHERKWTKHNEYKLTKNEISHGAKRTAILLSPELKNGFERIHTSIIKTDRYEFKSNSISEEFIAPIKEKNKEHKKTENREIKKNKLSNINSDNKEDFIDI